MGLNPDLNNCTGSGCGGGNGQCSGGGCNGGSCGGSGCSNHSANSDACTDRVTLGDDGYRGGAGKESIKIRLEAILKEYYDETCNRPTLDQVHYVKTEEECDGSIPYKYANGVAYKCMNGFWYAADGGSIKDLNQTYETQKAKDPLYFSVGGGSNPCKEEPIYDHHGCIVGYKPFLVAEGEFGIWNTTEIYPMTKNCGSMDQAGDCEYVYGDLAGKNVRLFRTPSVSREPFYIGGRDGVPNRYDGAGMEDDGAYVLMIGLRVEGITPPKNLPKPLCKSNPYTITYVERTEANKSVIASGLMINTFIGDIGGDKVLVPKVGLNGPEYYDVHLNNNNTFFRGGEGESPVPAYVFHSPDMHLRRPNTDAYRIIIEGEPHGEGFRYGLHDRGDPPEDFYKERKQQKGARQALNLSRFIPYGDPIVRCVKGLAYVRPNTKISNDDRFTYPLLNTYKESCAYLELNPGSGKVPLFNGATTFQPMPAGDPRYADESFIGDTKNHERILKGAANYATITRYIPNQYGSPILQTYIPIGLEIGADENENPLSGGSGLVGDSFVNGYSIKRTSFISDKTPEFIVSRPTDPSMGRIKRFGWLMRFLWRILGIKGWAELPLSGNEGDFTNRLHLNNRNGPANASGSDIYYYSLVKTNIWAYFNSDCNLHFRQTGAPELGEVHVHRLKGLNRDSGLPFGSKWQDGFLNRFYVPWNVASGFKQLLLTIALFAWCYIIGGTIIINGFNDMSQIVAGLSTSVLAWVISALEVIIGVVWIVIWATSSQDNRIIASMLGIDLQTPDMEWGTTPSRGGSRWAMREGRARNFENHYNHINGDYSLPNNPEKNFGMGDPYVTCLCPCEKNNKIVYSNKQYQGSHIDSWANFKTNNFLDIDAGLGKLAKIFEMGGRLFAHTSDHLVPISIDRSRIDQSQLGEGRLLNGSLAISGGVIEGVAGLLDPNAAVVTGWGYIYPDRESKDWYVFNGGVPESLGVLGCQQFFNENMGFELLKQFPEFNLIDKKIDGGIGYSIGVDHENKYLFLTKIDYKSSEKESKVSGPDGCMISKPMRADCNKSWTITLDIENKKWVGFEYFTPHLYGWNRFDVYSFNKEAMWRHNVQGKFQEFYGKKYPTSIEISVIDRQIFDDFDYQSTILDTEAYKWKDCDYIRSPKITFDKLIAYNSHQNTGEVDLFNNNDDLTPAERSRGKIDTINLEFKGRRWQFSELIDKLRDFNEFQFECSCEVAPRKLNQANFSQKEGNYSFNDNHLIYRLTFSKHSDVKLFLKNIQTLVDAEHEV